MEIELIEHIEHIDTETRESMTKFIVKNNFTNGFIKRKMCLIRRRGILLGEKQQNVYYK